MCLTHDRILSLLLVTGGGCQLAVQYNIISLLSAALQNPNDHMSPNTTNKFNNSS